MPQTRMWHVCIYELENILEVNILFHKQIQKYENFQDKALSFYRYWKKEKWKELPLNQDKIVIQL